MWIYAGLEGSQKSVFLKGALKKLSDKSMTTWVAKQMHSALDTETVQKGAERTGQSHFSIQILLMTVL